MNIKPGILNAKLIFLLFNSTTPSFPFNLTSVSAFGWYETGSVGASFFLTFSSINAEKESTDLSLL